MASMNLYATTIAEDCHLMFPAAQPGEINLTSMNGERRLRLSEKFMDAPGTAKADCLIAADIANALKALYRGEGNAAMAKRFDGFEWKTEEDAFNDGFRRAGRPGVGPIDSQGATQDIWPPTLCCARRATMACSCRSSGWTATS